MRANEIFEGKWWEFGDTMTLYHGTSDQMLDKISKEGLKAPINAVDYAIEVLKDYEDQINLKKMTELVKQDVGGYRGFEPGEKSKSVYFHLDFDRAAQYAEAYAEHGGEIAYQVFNIVKRYAAVQMPRWVNAKPVVLIVEVPYDWVNHYGHDFKTIYQNVTKSGSVNTKELDDISTHIEARIERDIPPSMIKKIMEV